jgi:hypothetical protein
MARAPRAAAHDRLYGFGILRDVIGKGMFPNSAPVAGTHRQPVGTLNQLPPARASL